MSDDVVICVRATKKGEFVPEPGRRRFLVVPQGQDPSLDHVIDRRDWVNMVMKEAEHTTDPIRGKPAGDTLRDYV